MKRPVFKIDIEAAGCRVQIQITLSSGANRIAKNIPPSHRQTLALKLQHPLPLLYHRLNCKNQLTLVLKGCIHHSIHDGPTLDLTYIVNFGEQNFELSPNGHRHRSECGGALLSDYLERITYCATHKYAKKGRFAFKLAELSGVMLQVPSGPYRQDCYYYTTRFSARNLDQAPRINLLARPHTVSGFRKVYCDRTFSANIQPKIFKLTIFISSMRTRLIYNSL